MYLYDLTSNWHKFMIIAELLSTKASAIHDDIVRSSVQISKRRNFFLDQATSVLLESLRRPWKESCGLGEDGREE